MAGYGSQIIPRRACSTTCMPRPWCWRTRPGTRVAIVTLDLVGIGPDVADSDPGRAGQQVPPAGVARRDLLFAHAQRAGRRAQPATRCTTTWSTSPAAKADRPYAASFSERIVGLVAARSPRLDQPALLRQGHGHLRRQSPQQQGSRGRPAAGRRQAGRPVRPRRAGAQDHRRRRQAHGRAVWLRLPCHRADRLRLVERLSGFAQSELESRTPVAPRCSSPAAGPIRIRCPAARSSWPSNMAASWPPRSTPC